MKLIATSDKRYISFRHESPAEYRFLLKFPAFIRENEGFYAPSKPNIVKNIVKRLQDRKVKLSVDDYTNSLLKPRELDSLPDWFKFITKPEEAQTLALRYVYTTKGGGLLLDPGMGKTKVQLDAIWLLQLQKFLVIAPVALLSNWEDEIQLHRPELTSHVVRTTNWEKELPQILKANVIIINYRKASLLLDKLKTISWDGMTIDEGLIKDPNSAQTQAITSLSARVPYRFLMSGTLINNSAGDCFAPVRYLEPSLFGTGITRFKEEYGVYIEANQGGSKKKILVNYKRAAEIRSVLESCCIVMSKEKWLKLPSKTFKYIYTQMNEEQRTVYNDLSSNYMVTVQGREIAVENPLSVMAKLSQISNGFLYYSEGDSDCLDDLFCGFNSDDLFSKSKKKTTKKSNISGRETLWLGENAKVYELIRLLKEGELTGKRTMVWYNMSAEKEQITKALDLADITYLTIAGGTKDIGGIVRQFNRDPSIRVLLCQAKAVNYGVTVLGTDRSKLEEDGIEILPGIDTNVHTQVFFSLNFSLEVFLQQQDRIHRIGQKHDCIYYILLSNSHVEARVKQAIEEKQDIRRMFLVDIKDRGKVLKETLNKRAKKENKTTTETNLSEVITNDGTEDDSALSMAFD